MKLLLLSDLHFFSPTYSPLQLFSKRITANINMLMNRKKTINLSKMQHFLKIFKQLNPDHILISGDLTCSTRSVELVQALSFINKLSKITPSIHLIPGNHDSYTLFSRKRYYKTFNESDLETQRVKHVILNKEWDLLLLDTCYFFPHFFANGYFSPLLEQRLKSKLDSIGGNKSIIIMNHFPLEPYAFPQKHLIRFAALQELLSAYSHVKLYISGHKHRASIQKGPFTQIQNPALFHESKGGFYIVDLKHSKCSIKLK